MYQLFILIPLFAVILLNLPLRRLMIRSAFWLVLALSLAQVFFALRLGLNPVNTSSTLLSSLFNFKLSADTLSLVLLLSIGIVSIAGLLSARYVMKSEGSLFLFSNMLLLIAAGMNGVVLVRDIFSLYIFLEITAVASFILIAFYKDIEALEGAFKYIILSGFATALMLVAIALLVLLSGTTDFAGLSVALKASPHPRFIMLALLLFMGGLLIKAGLMPFHGWLPDAYSSAPAPVSVLLAGIVTKTAGVYTLMRIMISVFSFNHSVNAVLMAVGTISIVLGALAALGQTDLKRMLAYSSISQVGYIILGLGCATPLAIAGAIFHIFNHAIFKTLLFVNSTAVEAQAGTRDMSRMGGLAQKMPVTGTTSVLASLSAAGIPPLAGFWSKLIIVIALWASGNHAYAMIAVLASLLTLAYFLYMQRMSFFGKLSAEFNNIKEAGWPVTLASVMLGSIIIAVGLFFPFMFSSLKVFFGG